MSKNITVLVLAASLMFLWGCTKSFLCKTNRNWSVTYSETNPDTQEIIKGVPPDVSAITFIREPQFVKCAGRMFIQIDGEEVGPVATHTHVVVYVPPGEHEVTSSGHSIWSVNIKSALGKVRLETYPGRAYFVSGIFDEGMVTIRQLSVEEAD
jgi:hypothetical protein